MSQGGLFPRWRPITKRVLDLFGRWGDPRTNLKSMMDSIIPVVVVDRFRDDDEGSIFGISAFTQTGGGFAGEFPSISFGSGVNDWELLGVTAFFVNYNGNTGVKFFNIHMFTPIEPYNPALSPSPVGVFPSGMLTNRAFTFGTVSAIGGYNPAPPAILGPTIAGPFLTGVGTQSVGVIDNFGNMMQPVPIRIYRDTTLTMQYVGTLGVGVNTVELDISILYRERPKVSA